MKRFLRSLLVHPNKSTSSTAKPPRYAPVDAVNLPEKTNPARQESTQESSPAQPLPAKPSPSEAKQQSPLNRPKRPRKTASAKNPPAQPKPKKSAPRRNLPGKAATFNRVLPRPAKQKSALPKPVRKLPSSPKRLGDQSARLRALKQAPAKKNSLRTTSSTLIHAGAKDREKKQPTTAPTPESTALAEVRTAPISSAEEISRALARRSQPVGTPTSRQQKTGKSPWARKPQTQRLQQAEEATAAAKDSTVDSEAESSEADALAIPPESQEVRKNKRARLRQVKALDGVRGLAVLAVVIYHFFGDILPGGYLGVDMFFVLSGFLITSLLVREFRVNGRISLRDFWLRRFRRILPAAVVVLVICTAVVSAIGGDLAVGIRQQFFGTLFFVNNWTQIATSQSYFAENEVQVFAHYWSLAVEEQFYLIWPLLMLAVFVLCRRYPRRVPIAVAAVLAIASGIAMALIYTPGEDPTRVYYGTDTHAFGLLIGATLSLLVTSTQRDPRADSWPTGGKSISTLAGVVGVIATVGFLAQLFLMASDLDITYRGGLASTSVLGALMIWGVLHESAPLQLLFANRVMRWLGQRSFSLYLWHWPLIMILKALFDADPAKDRSVLLGIICLPLSFLLAEITYQYVENPLRRAGFKKTWENYLSARPSLQEIRSGLRKVAWPLVPVLVVASLIGVAYGVLNSTDKTQLEQELDRLQNINQSGAAAPIPTAPSPPASEQNEGTLPMPQGPEITAVGDSVMLASSQALNSRFPGIYIDADVSRHYSAVAPAINAMKQAGTLRPTVFLGLGTNGAGLPGQLDEVLDSIGSDHTIVLSVPYGDHEWMPQARAEVVQAARERDNVYIADWCTKASANPQLLYTDGVHPAGQGANEYSLAFQSALEQYAKHEKNPETSCTT